MAIIKDSTFMLGADSAQAIEIFFFCMLWLLFEQKHVNTYLGIFGIFAIFFHLSFMHQYVYKIEMG